MRRLILKVMHTFSESGNGKTKGMRAQNRSGTVMHIVHTPY
jgi:hypothetical protein